MIQVGRLSGMETRTNDRIALRRLDMPLTPAVASAPLVASRHVGKRISLYGMARCRGANRQCRSEVRGAFTVATMPAVMGSVHDHASRGVRMVSKRCAVVERDVVHPSRRVSKPDHRIQQLRIEMISCGKGGID